MIKRILLLLTLVTILVVTPLISGCGGMGSQNQNMGNNYMNNRQ
jgi:hypothetical protein